MREVPAVRGGVAAVREGVAAVRGRYFWDEMGRE